MEKELISRAIALFGKDLSINEIHRHLYDGLIPNAGKLREENVYKDGFAFEMASYLKSTLQMIEKMPEGTLEDIVNKYIEMVIAHPFMEGNDFTLRIWLNMVLKKNLNAIIDWSLIQKEDYEAAVKRSAINPDILLMLLEGALSKDAENKEVLIRSIESSIIYG